VAGVLAVLSRDSSCHRR